MRKILIAGLCVSILFVMGCSSLVRMSPTEPGARDGDLNFVEPEPSEWVIYQAILNEYFYHRTQAVIENDMDILHERYPSLSENISIEEGINIEGTEVKSYNEGLTLIDTNYNFEHYDRLKVNRVSENEAVLLVHGLNLYMTADFGESGGEFLMEVHLKKNDDHWEIIKTDEYTISEYHAWLDEKK